MRRPAAKPVGDHQSSHRGDDDDEEEEEEAETGLFCVVMNLKLNHKL